MRVGERASDRDADLEQLLVLERIVGDQLGEGLAVNELGDQVEAPLGGLRLIEGDDRRMRQSRRGERLAGRSLAVPVGSERDTLDRHLAAE
jgi:hypothetical protein